MPNSRPLRLSYSSLNLLNSCERKFQLQKLLVNEGVREDSADMAFGRGYDAGFASYMTYQDPERAIFDAWLGYDSFLETEKKNSAKLVNAMQCSFRAMDEILEEYEVATFNGKKATQLSYRLNINPSYYFVGFIDAVLKHRYRGTYKVVDAKTTGSELYDLSPMYQNSAQGLGYSIALDEIAGEEVNEPEVSYFVLQTGRGWTPKCTLHSFTKTLLDRLNWFMSLGLDIERLEKMRQLNTFPMRGNHCLSFNKPCLFFGTCDLYSQDVPAEIEEDLTEYDFTFDLSSLIENHLRRIQNHAR